MCQHNQDRRRRNEFENPDNVREDGMRGVQVKENDIGLQSLGNGEGLDDTGCNAGNCQAGLIASENLSQCFIDGHVAASNEDLKGSFLSCNLFHNGKIALRSWRTIRELTKESPVFGGRPGLPSQNLRAGETIPLTGLEEMMFVSVIAQFDVIAHLQFGEDAAAKRADRFDTERKTGGDLLEGLARGHEREHFILTAGQGVVGRFFGATDFGSEFFGQGRADITAAGQ